jgi:hypothetical protein
MSIVFQNINPPPSPPGECEPLCEPLVRGEHTLAGWRGGWEVNVLEDARHCSVLYIRKYVLCDLSALVGHKETQFLVFKGNI